MSSAAFIRHPFMPLLSTFHARTAESGATGQGNNDLASIVFVAIIITTHKNEQARFVLLMLVMIDTNGRLITIVQMPC